MKRFLEHIRKEERKLSLRSRITNTILVTVLGITLGNISKWLDSRTFDKPILDYLDLGNFFSDMAIWLFIALSIAIFSESPHRAGVNVLLFFLGMTVSYHAYTVVLNGFNPGRYMMIWYGFTLISPVLAYFSWYAKSNSKYSIIIDSIIIHIMLVSCFGIGMWYFDIKGMLYTITFIASLLVIYKDIKIITVSFVIGLILSILLKMV